MHLTVRSLSHGDENAWDAFVREHPGANLYHLSAWKKVLESAYGHRTYFLIAWEKRDPASHSSGTDPGAEETVAGVLPLVHMKHLFFGNRLTSLPFFDLGGILSRDEEAEKVLISEAVRLGIGLKADCIELRHTQAHACLEPDSGWDPGEQEGRGKNCRMWTSSQKVRMLLGLPSSPDELMKSFKAKLRSQIRKPQKEGLTAEVGGEELLDDFYQVFVVNMRALGSPVHAKRLMFHVMETFREQARIVICRKDAVPVACSFVLAFGDTLYNPWASALRAYNRFSPNMLLYWSMMEHAIENGLSRFDFGRSTPGEGTFKFKEQWGALPEPLNWQFVFLGAKEREESISENSLMQKAGRYWSRLPIPVTRVVGPMIRKHIGL